MNDSQRRVLLKTARDAVDAVINRRVTPAPESDDPQLNAHCGCFVTLKNGERLRGCIGNFVSQRPLIELTVEMAKSSATGDPRFFADPITAGELEQLDIEISVLSLPKAVKNPAEIKIGKHGIIISKGLLKGLLLPQVPVEWNWDLETYLRHGCIKAGLNEDEWKKDAKIEIFDAQVFSESTS